MMNYNFNFYSMDQQPKAQQTKNVSKNLPYRYFLVLVVIIFVLLLFFLYQTRKKSQSEQNYTAITPPAPVILNAGSFSINSVTTEKVVDVYKALDMEIVASSDQKPIVGYDIILKFEKGSLEIISAESLLPDFALYKLGKSDHYILTGAKKLDAIEPTLLENTPIVRLRVMPKRTGPLKLTIVDKLGLEKSQLVDEKTQILFPKVGEITLEIK